MRVIRFMIAATFVLGYGSLAFAASDGNFTPARQHCSGDADNSDAPNRAEDGCHNYTMTISDGGGHEYFGFGIPQTKWHEKGPVPDVIPFGTGSSTHAMEVWYDLGQGCTRYKSDANSPGAPAPDSCPWMDPSAVNYYPEFAVAPTPASGLRLYIGADDNLAGGEHDSSPTANSGPSDGGAVVLNLNPASLMKWMGYVMTGNVPKLLVHPLPLVDTGIGFCADGICMSTQTTRRDKTYPGSTPSNYQPVANYDGHQWDPNPCSGASAETNPQHPDGLANEINDCSDATHPNYTVQDWNNLNGDPAIEPGVQIYEDPDAQGSPIGPYPLPAIYVGTCGVILGGGPSGQMPASQFTNSATGQIVIPTGCDQSSDDYYTFGPVM